MVLLVGFGICNMGKYGDLFVWFARNPDWLYACAGFAAGLIAPKIFKVLFLILRRLGVSLNLYGLIPTLILKRAYPKTNMARKIRIKVARNESIIFEIDKRSRCRAWLNIENNLPFDIEFEELLARIYFDAMHINISLAEKLSIPRLGTANDIVLKGELSKEQAANCSRKMEKYLAMEISGRFSTRFNDIDTNSGHLVGYRVRDLRLAKYGY